jgi:hypothetical protein
MSDALSFAEFEAQDVQLLPARIVLSVLMAPGGGGTPGHNGSSHPGIGLKTGNVSFPPGGQTNIVGQGIGGPGGSAY